LECGKKLRLKLKTNPSKELERKTEIRPVIKHQIPKNEKLEENILKTIDKRV
jgi:hypothetical protein